MTTTARRLYGPALLGSVAGALATVPAGVKWLLRGVVVVNESTSATGEWRLGINGSAAADRLWHEKGQAVTSTSSLDPWWVLNAGDALWGVALAGSLTISVFGYELPA